MEQCDYRYYSDEQLKIASIDNKLSIEEKRIIILYKILTKYKIKVEISLPLEQKDKLLIY